MLLFEQINSFKAFSLEVAAVAMPLLQLHGVGKAQNEDKSGEIAV